MTDRVRVLLTIAGSDSGGGAGIQADTRAFWDHGWHGATVITAVTAQDTAGVTRVDPVPPAGVRAQLDAVLGDLDVAAVKIGMLGDAATVRAVAQGLDDHGLTCPVVLDPVMIATSGDRLLTEDAIAALRDLLIPRATLLTPNRPEAGALLAAADLSDGPTLARALFAATGVPSLVTGGDAPGDEVVDALHDGTGARAWRLPRLPAGSHGTGCTLASAVAAGLAGGRPLDEAVGEAIAYVRLRLARARRIGRGSTVLG